MSDHWLYSERLPAGPGEWTLEGPEAQHARAKRLERGESIHLFDGRGTVAAAEVVDAARQVLRVRITDRVPHPPRQPRLTVAVSPPKGERLDWMLEKLTELGVAAILPLACDRSVVRAQAERLDRWQRRLIEAAKQAHVAWLPELHPAADVAALLAAAQRHSHAYVADTAGPAQPAVQAAAGAGDAPLVLIGPEGGFSEPERLAMAQARVTAITLGPTVLRTETAAIVAAAAVLLEADARMAGTRQV